MTAEIAVMNKMAVALAADSAGTVDFKTRRQIHKSVNKLFMLSKYEPIGIMIYQGLDFMGIPWETIIKLYRKNCLDKEKLDTVTDYANSLFEFIEKEYMGSEDGQKEYFRKIVHYKFAKIKNNLKNPKVTLNLFLELFDKYGDDFTNSEDRWRIVSEFFISKTCKKLRENVDYFWNELPQEFIKLILDNYGDIIQDEIEKLDEIVISEEASKHLKDIAVYSAYEKTTGVVFAGFGEKDLFPSVHTYTLGGIYCNELRYVANNDETAKVGLAEPAHIIPFAQHEMVDAFLEGVTPQYHSESENYLKKIVDEYPEDIIEIIEKFKDDEVDQNTIKIVIEKIKEIQAKKDDLLDDYKEGMETLKNAHKMPIYDAVINLPKDDLAALAESMVNITSLKRKYSFNQDETVGGTIDVAVISKGDGFVWIKRKHYFNPDLNHQFFENYYEDPK